MSPDVARVGHMRDAVRMALRFVEGRERHDLDSDPMLALSLIKLLEIVGEAAKRVSSGTQSRAPGVPWRQMAGTRDRLVHGYFDVNLDIVWDIATLELAPLLPQLDILSEQLGAP